MFKSVEELTKELICLQDDSENISTKISEIKEKLSALLNCKKVARIDFDYLGEDDCFKFNC
jgi:chaperonin cofactor prefoldin